VLGTASIPAHEAGLFGCQRKIMPTAEEIRDFAAEEGFREQGCENELGCGTDCPECGGKGVVYIMHGVTWPPVAIEMMMADRARREEFAAAAKDASVSLHHARGQNDFAERERGLNEVNQQLMNIWTKAQGARIE
jgi:hypothetical protein